MSFTDSTPKPKLVEGKIIDKIIKVQKNIEENNITFTKQVFNKIFELIKNNILSFIILMAIIILLFYRYNEVKNRKKTKKVEIKKITPI